jgi:diguanylate cyclase (GGDEF)-like protein/PAS domain S-box-containing protein
MHESEARFRALTENALDMVFVVDTEGVVTYCSPSVKRILGYDITHLADHTFYDFLAPEERNAVRASFEWLAAKPGRRAPRELSFRLRRADGSMRWVETLGSNCVDVPAVRGVVVNVRDVHERQVAEEVREAEQRVFNERLRHMAHHDVLTGLPNRLLLSDRLGQALKASGRSGSNVAVLFIDLDGFKEVNDQFGHDQGDVLLVEVARRLQLAVRAVDTVARLGGDEFVIMLPAIGDAGASAPSAAALEVANKVLRALAFPVALAGAEVHVSGSVGVAFSPDHGVTASDLMKNADAAMYRAKAAGRATVRVFGESA